MRNALILLFLVTSYNFILWAITTYGFSPVPLFPEDPYHTILVLAYNSVLYVSWLFGERERTVQWIGYLFFFQIIALSIYLGDLGVIVRDLPPVILTFALVALFESPTERKIREAEKEREELLKELDRIRRERERVEVHLRMLQKEIGEIEKEKQKEDLSAEALKELEDRLTKLQNELKEYREKETRLLEANRKLFQLLEVFRSESESGTGKEEVASLRKERKRLIKELLQLQELLDMYADENERLKEENERLRRKVDKLTVELGKLEVEKEETCDEKSIIRDLLKEIFQLKFSEKAVDELLKLTPEKRRIFLKELLRFSLRNGQENVQPLTTLPNIYKLRFSGGRIYLRRYNGSWEVVGMLGSEEDKEKERYIRDVLSKIV